MVRSGLVRSIKGGGPRIGGSSPSETTVPFTKTDIQGFIDCINDGEPLPALPVTMITPEGVDPFPLRPGLLDLLAAVTCCIWSEKYGDTV